MDVRTSLRDGLTHILGSLLQPSFPFAGEDVMLSIELMRAEEVSAMYNGARWRRRVRRMNDDQVIAIFLRERKKAEENARNKKEEKSDDDDIPF